jgi:REP element-mobilizing transposase RayT
MASDQLDLTLKSRFRHGGVRNGAGRPKKKGDFPRHSARPKVLGRTPLHITIKLMPNLSSLRTGTILQAFAHAVKAAANHGLRIQHFSLQINHVHLIAEAENNRALATGMQSLNVSLARALNRLRHGRAAIRRGAVFLERYHLHVLKTPTGVKNAIRYVLTNAAKHERVKPFLDQYSSAWHFADWKEAFGAETERRLRRGLHERPRWIGILGDFLSPARSWLLKEGWKRAPAH